MNKGVLVIYDVDEEYANRLMEYISDKQGLPLRTIVFTDIETLINYTNEDYVDILLISASAMEERLSNQNIGKIILLSSGNVFSQYIGYSSVYKYQSTENIIREVLDYYVEVRRDDGMVDILRENTEIIGVYSPIGRSGKTTFALTMGQILAEEHSVLYINMEEFAAFDKIFEKNYGGDLSDLMYFFKQNSEALPIKLQAIIDNMHGMDYVPPLVYSADLRNLNTEEWIELILKIAKEGTYEKIILDFGSVVKDVFQMLDVCNQIYMPIDDDIVSLMKIAVFEEYLLKSERENVLNRVVKVKIPKVETMAEGEDFYKNQLWGALGDFVRKILKEGVE